jgi:NurA-like 5'-3' nuclease
LVDLVHSVVLTECRKGQGYPLILSEAHERAVIRAGDRAAFYRLMERELEAGGLPLGISRKSAAKRLSAV